MANTASADHVHAMTAHFARVAVLGLGLIGGSLLQRHPPGRAATWSASTSTSRPPRPPAPPDSRCAPTDEAALHGADLVVLAMPLPQVPDALRSLAPHLRRATPLLTDVGTLKAPGARRGRAIHAERPIRRRPPAGRHRGERLGRHRPAAVPRRPVDAHASRTTPTWSRGCASPSWSATWARSRCPTTAAEQDAAVARVIGLPHVLAEALALTGLDGGPLGLSLAAGLVHVRAPAWPAPAPTWSRPGATATRPLVDALDDVIARLSAARDELAADTLGATTWPMAGHDRPDELGAPPVRSRSSCPPTARPCAPTAAAAAGSPPCCATTTACGCSACARSLR